MQLKNANLYLYNTFYKIQKSSKSLKMHRYKYKNFMKISMEDYKLIILTLVVPVLNIL